MQSLSRVTAALCAMLLSATFAPRVQAQVEVVGGGCTVPSGGTAGVPDTRGGQPRLGNFDFELRYTCPPSSSSLFALIGRCLPGPDFGVFPPSPCGSNCGLRIDAKSFLMAGADLEGKVRIAKFPFSLPNLAELRGTTICVQFLCFDLTGEKPLCTEISQGVRVTPQ